MKLEVGSTKLEVRRQEKQWIEEYNLPSYRWRKRRIIKAWEKRLLQLKKERIQIINAIRKLGYEELEQPIRKGYERSFVLREDLKSGKEAEFYQNILQKINTSQYSDTKSFKRKKRRSKKKGYWKYEVRKQKLLEPDERNFKKLGFTDKEKNMFFVIDSYNYQCKQWVRNYVFAEPWRFVLKVRPYYITKIKIWDGDLVKREDEINRIIWDNGKNQRRLTRLRPSSNSWKAYRGEIDKYKSRIKFKDLPNWKIMEMYTIETEENETSS